MASSSSSTARTCAAGRRQLLTDGKSRHETFTLSRDGQRPGVLRHRPQRRRHRRLPGRRRQPEHRDAADRGAGTVAAGGLLPRRTEAAGGSVRSIDDGDLWVYDLAAKSRTRLTPDPATAGKASVRGAAFSGDGKSVYLVTDRGSEFAQLLRVEPREPRRRCQLTPDLTLGRGGARGGAGRDGGLRGQRGRLQQGLPRSRAASAPPLPLPSGVLNGDEVPRPEQRRADRRHRHPDLSERRLAVRR